MLIVGLLPLACVGEVVAQVTAITGGSPNHIDLSIPVKASVASACSSSVSGTYTVAEINNGFSHDFTFAISCNLPSRIAVQSLNGGLLAAVPTPPVNYSNIAPYQITLHLVGDAGVTPANAVCDANTLTSGASAPCTFRGPASASQGLQLTGASAAAQGSYLRVGASIYSAGKTLVAASSYTDTLTVTLSAVR